jgi:hypothetical protein
MNYFAITFAVNAHSLCRFVDDEPLAFVRCRYRMRLTCDHGRDQAHGCSEIGNLAQEAPGPKYWFSPESSLAFRSGTGKLELSIECVRIVACKEICGLTSQSLRLAIAIRFMVRL